MGVRPCSLHAFLYILQKMFIALSDKILGGETTLKSNDWGGRNDLIAP
jgi:hypothetical protein